jgi:uncharacterized protein YraI
MKRIFVFLSLLILVQAACSLTPSQDATRVAFMQTSIASGWTPTPDLTARLNSGRVNVYAGPGENYALVGSASDTLNITGQGLGCTWLAVASPAQSLTGWVKADQVSFTVSCANLPGAEIPPTPEPTATFTPLPTSTDTPEPTWTPVPTKKPASVPAPNVVDCMVNSNIIIANHSGAPFTLYLSGPAKFTFYLGADDYSTVLVCSGSYDYTVTGSCNGTPASGSGRISDGDQVTFFCN